MRRLESHVTLSEAEKVVLGGALGSRQRHKTSRASVADTHCPEGLTVILEGFAYRYKLLAVGRRQISGYFVAGDICSVRHSSLTRSDYCIGTLGPTETAILSPGEILSEPQRYPNLTRALWCSILAEQSIAREWISNVGPRTAYERVAHLFCELFVRLQWIGLTWEQRCNLPLTQRDLADATSLSSVHVNRVLRQMRMDGLLTFHRGLLTIPDLTALRTAAGFDSTYLYLPQAARI